MRHSLKWSTVTIALAGIVALAVVSPALGGPSLRKLVKKEVAKQIAKATGPAGANGTNGINGINGATNLNIRTATATGTATASCNPGEHATGGGGLDNSGGALKNSFPNIDSGTTPNGSWTAEAVTGTDSVTARIVCAAP
jgi:hypothetical protein